MGHMKTHTDLDIFHAVVDATNWMSVVGKGHENSSAYLFEGLHWLGSQVQLRRGVPLALHTDL